MKTRIILMVLVLIISFPLFAVPQKIYSFKNNAQQKQFDNLTHELRCLVCQNQDLYDSDAKLADDIRSQIRTMILAGQSSRHIKNYLQERFGDFIFYQPPLNSNTIILWFAPLIFLMIGLFFLIKLFGKT